MLLLPLPSPRLHCNSQARDPHPRSLYLLDTLLVHARMRPRLHAASSMSPGPVALPNSRTYCRYYPQAYSRIASPRLCTQQHNAGTAPCCICLCPITPRAGCPAATTPNWPLRLSARCSPPRRESRHLPLLPPPLPPRPTLRLLLHSARTAGQTLCLRLCLVRAFLRAPLVVLI